MSVDTTNPKYLRVFAVACREEDDEETAIVIDAVAIEIERLRGWLAYIAQDNGDARSCAKYALNGNPVHLTVTAGEV